MGSPSATSTVSSSRPVSIWKACSFPSAASPYTYSPLVLTQAATKSFASSPSHSKLLTTWPS